MWSNNDEIEGADKIKACIPYILPLIDGDHFGTFLYQRIPVLEMADFVLLQPIINFVHAIPFSSLLLFLALTLGTRNDRFSRGVKFNAQQAALIDVALVIPELVGGAMEGSDITRLFHVPFLLKWSHLHFSSGTNKGNLIWFLSPQITDDTIQYQAHICIVCEICARFHDVSWNIASFQSLLVARWKEADRKSVV